MFSHIEELTDKEREQLNKNVGYWADRAEKAQAKLAKKSANDVENKLVSNYRKASNKIIGQFEKVYDKVLAGKAEGINPTPADLYKLDSYWQMLAQTQKELQNLGDNIMPELAQGFFEHFQKVYDATALSTNPSFGTINNDAAMQLINEIWCADGKSWSSRIWDNTAQLQSALNDGLLECLLTGKQTNELKKSLQERFNISYRKASRLVRTEMAHIQTQAAKQRYKDSGIEYVEVLADKDERQCEICGKLHRQRFPINGAMPIPAHANCRCCIIPVVDDFNEQIVLDGF